MLLKKKFIFLQSIFEHSIMKKEIHPDDYRLVVFKDMSNDYAFLCPSCAPTKDTIKWEDGNDYPLVKLDISHSLTLSLPVLLSLLIQLVELISSRIVTAGT